MGDQDGVNKETQRRTAHHTAHHTAESQLARAAEVLHSSDAMFWGSESAWRGINSKWDQKTPQKLL